MVAHELATGKTRWFTPRMTGAQAEECDAYTTPLLVDVAGQPRLIVMGGNQLDAYDPRDGKQIWYMKDLVGGRTVTNPTISDGMIFATRGKRGDLFAIDLQQRLAKSTGVELSGVTIRAHPTRAVRSVIDGCSSRSRTTGLHAVSITTQANCDGKSDCPANTKLRQCTCRDGSFS